MRAHCSESLLYIFSCNTFSAATDFFGCSAGHDPAAVLTAFRAHVDDIIGAPDDIQIVLDDDNGRAAADERAEHLQQCFYVLRVQTDGGLIKNEYRIILLSAQF